MDFEDFEVTIDGSTYVYQVPFLVDVIGEGKDYEGKCTREYSEWDDTELHRVKAAAAAAKTENKFMFK